MCIAALAWRAHPGLLLVCAANRDEYHERPAAPLARWDDGSGIIAGRDLRSGGTWLGVSPSRFALVTNLRGHGEPNPALASRGALVIDMLQQDADSPASPLACNPYNLIFARPDGAGFACNRPEPVATGLGHGVYGLSNGKLDEPWPKTLQLKAALTDWLAAGTRDFAPLFAALASERLDAIGLHPDEPSDVPREAPETPVFIRDPVYGTRCSTVVVVDAQGQGTIIERCFAPNGAPAGSDRAYSFVWAVADRPRT